MYTFFEKGIRGGCAFVNEHHIKRNVPNEKEFDSSQPRTEMLYIDAVTLNINYLKIFQLL